MEGIELQSITKKFGAVTAVDSASFRVEKGEFMSLLGPSGCGKTTVLRMIAGFEKPTAGSVKIGGVDVTKVLPFKRHIGLVFQNYALWPHMTVFEIIAFGLKLRKNSRQEIAAKVEEILSLTNLSGLEKRFPRELSGGQQQRVALARSLVLDPKVLLMDEPLSNLDRKMRINMRIELKQLQERLGMTTLYVTHDQEEALSLSDRVAIMNKGKIVRIGAPAEIYETPTCDFEADFVGTINIMKAVVERVNGEVMEIRTQEGLGLHMPRNRGLDAGDDIHVLVRPEKLRIFRSAQGHENLLPGEVIFADYFGSIIKYYIKLNDGYQAIVESQNQDERFRIGDEIFLMIDPRHCIPIKQEEGSHEQ